MKLRLFIYIFLTVFSSVVATLLFINEEYVYFGLVVALVVILVIIILNEYKANARKLTYMLSAIENEDYSFRFFERGSKGYNRLFNSTLNRIKGVLLREKRDAREKEKYFEILLNNVITGIVTVNRRGDILNCNTKALELFGLSILTHVEQLRKIDETLFQAFTYAQNVDRMVDDKKRIKLFNEKGQIHLSLNYTSVEIKNERLILIAINDIGNELEDKEMDSWSRLIRVLTHEIMNTVTPIASLSETLATSSDKLPKEVKHGLGVIHTTSKGLISFVESYRGMTRIPTPIKKVVSVKEFIDKILTLMKEEFNDRNVNFVYQSDREEDIMFFIDENLISQVMVNIIRNGILATDGYTDTPTIKITSRIEFPSEDIVIEISNNGKPIPTEMQEQIFVPFFTTRDSGTGIGLSISRQIMRQHNGSLQLKSSNEEETTFVLMFR